MATPERDGERVGEQPAPSEPGVGAGIGSGAGNGGRSALLIDWGGVLTSNLFDSFRDYCERVEIDPQTLRGRFGSDPACRELLIALEKGELEEPDFERKLAAVLEIESDGLIDGLFAGVQPDVAMVDAVRRAREGGVRTALVSNSWGVHRYPHDIFDELFDGVVISARRARASRRGGCTSSAPNAPASLPSKPSTSMTCRSTSNRPRSSAWRPCTTRAPRRRSPSSNACSGSRCARATSATGSAAATRLLGEARPCWIDAFAAQQLRFDGKNVLDALALAEHVADRLLYSLHPVTLITRL